MIKTDCIYFPLDRPCVFHKEQGAHCDTCSRYAPAAESRSAATSILVIKLDAMGDVLRTTFILPGLKELYPNARITWITAPGSVPILAKNPFIHEVLPFDRSVFGVLLGTCFDVVINLDLSPQSLSLASLPLARKRIGYWLGKGRTVRCSNAAARHWLSMSAFDDVKKRNRRTYQHWMARIIGLKKSDYEIYVPLTKAARAKAAAFAKKHGLQEKTVVGINPGAGGRWRHKRWTAAGYSAIIDRLSAAGVKVLLLGGPEEHGLITLLAKKSAGKAVSAGTDNSLEDFFALVNLCGLLLCGDTLALHVALGLKKKAVALFGPTSAPEIEMYGRGIKIAPSVPCITCYRPQCTVHPTCMDSITPDEVWAAIRELLKP